MTIKDYILQKLSAFGAISEAELLDMSNTGDFTLNDEYDTDTTQAVGVAITHFIEGKVLAPTVKSVSEGGFSASWDYSNLGKYYLWLCNKHDVKPNDTVLGLLGVNVIRDVSNLW